MKKHSFFKTGAGFVLGATLLVSQAASVHAFSFHKGELKGAFDTDLTYGISMRTEDADSNNFGAQGNRNFQDAGDVFSNAIRGSSTLALDYGGYGLLARGNYFYDNAYDQENLADQAHDKLVRDVALTDLMVYGYFGDNDQVNIRLGKQVISWGENTFIQGSINDINTVDLNKLRQPGRALKDAFIGTNAAYISWNIDDEWTVESFYLFEFDQIQLDPAGAFFTTLDAVGAGGGFDTAGDGVVGGVATGAATLPFGAPSGACISPDQLDDCGLVGGSLVRAADKFAKGGQYGLAIRKFFPEMFGGTEVAVYYQNLHDHTPMISSYYQTGQFFLEYVENIERLGMSFNTNIGGWAIGGEYHVRKDAPIQMTGGVLAGLAPGFGLCGGCAPGTEVTGYDLVDRHQMQLTFQRIWGVNEWLGADANSTLMEVAYGWVDGLPDKNESLFGPFRTVFTPQVTEHFWGFQIKQSITYEAALFNVASVSPFIAFKYDVDGVSNEIVPLFVDDRKALTVGANFGYGGGTWTGGVSWTIFDGANAMLNQAGSRLNGRTDRDFVQANISYSF